MCFFTYDSQVAYKLLQIWPVGHVNGTWTFVGTTVIIPVVGFCGSQVNLHIAALGTTQL